MDRETGRREMGKNDAIENRDDYGERRRKTDQSDRSTFMGFPPKHTVTFHYYLLCLMAKVCSALLVDRHDGCNE